MRTRSCPSGFHRRRERPLATGPGLPPSWTPSAGASRCSPATAGSGTTRFAARRARSFAPPPAPRVSSTASPARTSRAISLRTWPYSPHHRAAWSIRQWVRWTISACGPDGPPVPGTRRTRRWRDETPDAQMSSLGNTVKTFTLLAALGGLLVFVGGLLGGRGGMVIALLFAVAMNGLVYWKSDSLALRANGASELHPGELPRFRSIVSSLAARAGLPMPRLYIIDRPEPNAFATGRNPEHAAVAVTTGILDLMDDR